MNLLSELTKNILQSLVILYNESTDAKLIQLQKTKKEFTGDVTLVVFPLLRISKKKPEDTANEIGSYLKENLDLVIEYNVVKGFLNLVINDTYYLEFLNENAFKENFGIMSNRNPDDTYMVEYSSPNTNKPLHLGHIRNILLGYSVSRILEAAGKKVLKTNLKS